MEPTTVNISSNHELDCAVVSPAGGASARSLGTFGKKGMKASSTVDDELASMAGTEDIAGQEVSREHMVLKIGMKAASTVRQIIGHIIQLIINYY